MTCHFVAFTIITCLASLVQCDAWGSFIFPPNSSVTNFTLELPTVANIGTVHWNDDIVIQYTVPDTVKSLWLSQQCYGSVSDLNSTTGNSGTYSYSYGQYNESTGTLLYNLGNGTGYTGYPNYCMFAMFDYTIHKCSWGPFGLLEWDVGTGPFSGALMYSELFRIHPPESVDPALITNTAKTTLKTPAVTATTADVTCPPSGVPAAPITAAEPQITSIPKLADGIVFPEWNVIPQY